MFLLNVVTRLMLRLATHLLTGLGNQHIKLSRSDRGRPFVEGKNSFLRDFDG